MSQVGRPRITAERLRHVVSFDNETGVFTRRVHARRSRVGDVLGTISHKGYVQITLDYVKYSAHRLAWFYVHGVWPQGHIDHINGDKSDNRIANLRDVSRAINAQNLRASHRTNKTGLLGVAPCRTREGQFRAQISVNGRKKFLGNFVTAEAAHAAYVEAKRVYHPGSTL